MSNSIVYGLIIGVAFGFFVFFQAITASEKLFLWIAKNYFKYHKDLVTSSSRTVSCIKKELDGVKKELQNYMKDKTK